MVCFGDEGLVFKKWAAKQASASETQALGFISSFKF